MSEMAKLHVRYMVGGHTPKTAGALNELIYRFEFPERPGALMKFLENMSAGWNISLFHYRNHGADFGSRRSGGLPGATGRYGCFSGVPVRPGIPLSG